MLLCSDDDKGIVADTSGDRGKTQVGIPANTTKFYNLVPVIHTSFVRLKLG